MFQSALPLKVPHKTALFHYIRCNLQGPGSRAAALDREDRVATDP
jgi:hypothetical protein